MGTLLWRWNFAFALAAGEVPSVNAPLEKLAAALRAGGDAPQAEMYFRYATGREPTAAERAALDSAEAKLGPGDARHAPLLGLVLASPAFQRY